MRYEDQKICHGWDCISKTEDAKSMFQGLRKKMFQGLSKKRPKKMFQGLRAYFLIDCNPRRCEDTLSTLAGKY